MTNSLSLIFIYMAETQSGTSRKNQGGINMALQANFWQDHFVLHLTPQERYFYLYLLTCSKTTECGIYELPMQLAAIEIGYNRDVVENLLERFVTYGKVLYDKTTKELYLVDWVCYNPVTNANMEKYVLQELQRVKNKEFVYTYLYDCLEEELSIPLLLKHFGIHSEEACEISQEAVSAGTRLSDFYEQHFGILSPHIKEELASWTESFAEELVLKALQIAQENGEMTLAYVKEILRDWYEKGYTTLSEVEEAEVTF